MASARGMIAVDKMGTKVLFINPVTYETEVVLDGFDKTVHELLVMPEISPSVFIEAKSQNRGDRDESAA